MHQSTKEKSKVVQAIVKQHYEPERQDRCKLWVYRTQIKKMYQISERTFWRLMRIKTD